MNEIVNEDTLEYNHKYYYSIRNFLNNMLIVMPDSTVIKTSSDIEKSSFGLNLNEYIIYNKNILSSLISLFVGQQGFFGIATDLTLKLTKTAKQKFLYKINVDLSHSQSDVLTLIQKMRELYSHDINAVEMNVTRNGSQILIDSNQNVLPWWKFSLISFLDSFNA